MLAGEMLGLKSSGSLFIGILRSRTVEDRVINKFDLKSVYHVKRMITARKQLESNTDISEDRKSGIIAITVSDNSPQRALQRNPNLKDCGRSIPITTFEFVPCERV